MLRLYLVNFTNKMHSSVFSSSLIPWRSHSQKSEAEGKTPDVSSKKAESKRLAEFRKKIRETTDITDLGEQQLKPGSVKEDPLPPWPNNTNPHTGEVNGPRGPEPTRYGDWERKGRVSDF